MNHLAAEAFQLDFAIVGASFGITETGAVLLSDADLRVNALAFWHRT